MRAPGFWWQPEPTPLARALLPLGVAYGAVTAARMARPGAPAPVPVLCVGNLVAGGAGKTPAALAFAALLREAGRRPVFLSRGYGGRLRGPVEVDLRHHTAADCGDEPLLLAADGPAVIAADRVAGAVLAATLGDTVVMDDGLQNPALAKSLSIAVVDGEVGVGNRLCVPAGPLRAPLQAQLPHVDALVVIGPGAAGEAVAETARRMGKPVLQASLEPEPAAVSRLQDEDVLAFAGIGRPEKFFASLSRAGARVKAVRSFPDHHAYAAAEIRDLLSKAAREGLACWTTAKDRVRLAGVLPPQDLGRIDVLPVTLTFAEPQEARSLLAPLSGGGPP